MYKIICYMKKISVLLWLWPHQPFTKCMLTTEILLNDVSNHRQLNPFSTVCAIRSGDYLVSCVATPIKYNVDKPIMNISFPIELCVVINAPWEEKHAVLCCFYTILHQHDLAASRNEQVYFMHDIWAPLLSTIQTGCAKAWLNIDR